MTDRDKFYRTMPIVMRTSATYHAHNMVDQLVVSISKDTSLDPQQQAMKIAMHKILQEQLRLQAIAELELAIREWQGED